MADALPVDTPVRITDGRLAGRTGRVVRVPPSPFGDHRYVELDRRGRERTTKRELVAVSALNAACLHPMHDDDCDCGPPPVAETMQ